MSEIKGPWGVALTTNTRAKIYVYLDGRDLILKIAKLCRFERRLLPKISSRCTRNFKTALDQFNAVVPRPLLTPERMEKRTRLSADMGLTYIIKTFRAIQIHYRANSQLQNLSLMIKIIS